MALGGFFFSLGLVEEEEEEGASFFSFESSFGLVGGSRFVRFSPLSRFL